MPKVPEVGGVPQLQQVWARGQSRENLLLNPDLSRLGTGQVLSAPPSFVKWRKIAIPVPLRADRAR